MFVFKAGVVGAGTMGSEIAHVIAAADIPVVLVDADPAAIERGRGRARSIWQAQVDAGKLSPDELERRAGLIAGATDYAGLGDVDIVIEAVPERLELKREIFSRLDETTPGHAILATNTSALSITDIAEVTLRPDKVVGLHFMYPASSNRLVEVIEGEDTSTETAQATATFAQAIRRIPIRSADAPGFVVNRVLNAAVAEVWRTHEQSGLSIEEFDRLLAEGSPSGLGPFYISDLIGLDTCVAVAEHLHEVAGDRFHVHPQMREMVRAGRLGAKSGRGFYEHG
jgi:3-hydroxyacyl-CoA dehydrogenase